MPLSNPASITPVTSAGTTPTTVTSSATSVAILAANTSRKGGTVFNNSNATLYLDFDATASITDFGVKIDPGGYFELPYGFTGALSGIWASANGSALVREFS